MNKSFIKEILRDYEKRRDRAVFEQKLRQEEVYSKVPRVKEIDEEISRTGFLISKALLQNPETYEEKVEEIKNMMDELKKEKAILMTESNIPLEYTNINYTCNTCNDTGFLENGAKCNCFKQILIDRAYRMSNLQNLLDKENFRTFKINIFS